MSLKIGFTERGDAACDLSWFEKCLNHEVDGAVIITKHLTQAVMDRVMELTRKNFPVVLHVDCTGWGGSLVEPFVPDYKTQLERLKIIKDTDFPADRLVLRIDPVFPTRNGLARVNDVLTHAAAIDAIDVTSRIRISVLDEYRHVKDRFRKLGYDPIYGDSFHASPEQFHAVERLFKAWAERGYGPFETCAERDLHETVDGVLTFVHQGCLSEADLAAMGLSYDSDFVNPQNRSGCLCLGCKKELLAKKHPCPFKCQYCYWQD